MPGPVSDSYRGPDGGADVFVVINAPTGPLVMTNEDGSPAPPVALFATLREAQIAAKDNAAARVYGSEAFQLGCGEPLT
jgi:hypothetical protein